MTDQTQQSQPYPAPGGHPATGPTAGLQSATGPTSGSQPSPTPTVGSQLATGPTAGLQSATGPTAGAQPSPGAAPAPSRPKEILTLPPLQHLTDETPPSPRTGEPTRPAMVLVAMVLLCLAAAGVAVTYAVHWWAAVHPADYPTSARLIQWLEPEPGKWLSLTLEGVLAVVAALVAGVSGFVGFHAWNGWRWTRWGGIVAVVLNGAVAALFTWWGLIGVGLALAGTVLLFLPSSGAYFRRFGRHRSKKDPGYRRPHSIFYGRLPRFR